MQRFKHSPFSELNKLSMSGLQLGEDGGMRTGSNANGRQGRPEPLRKRHGRDRWAAAPSVAHQPPFSNTARNSAGVAAGIPPLGKCFTLRVTIMSAPAWVAVKNCTASSKSGILASIA
jgi:hypothetical protein